jgi:transcriptional regulator with XRE-family HTH domain
MTYAGTYIFEALKSAREAKQLSQRAFGAKAGVPQSHISKIESGAVDPQLSTVIELARLLDLELMFVPRALVPAVRGIVRSPEILSAARARASRETQKELARIRDAIDGFEGFEGFEPSREDATRLDTLAIELSTLPLGAKQLAAIRRVSANLKDLPKGKEGADRIRQVLRSLQRVRNAVVHDVTADTHVRAAYSLENEDSDG